MNKNQHIDYLLDQLVNNKITDTDLLSLQEALNANDNSKFGKHLYKHWNTSEQEISTFELNGILHSIHSNKAMPKKINLTQIIIKIAAMLLLPLLAYNISLTINKSHKQEIESFTYIETPLGSKQKTLLCDGTSIWLNSGSKIKYSSQYSSTNRTIYLEGEAYFEVKSDKENPFFVITKHGKIVVTGTKFNIYSYQDDSLTSISLKTGVLKYEDIYTKKTYNIKPGETLNAYHGDIVKITKGINKAISWTKGILIFSNDSMLTVVKKLNRWYNTNIILDRKLEKYRISITIEKESLEKTLNYIKQILPIEITYNTNNIIDIKKK